MVRRVTTRSQRKATADAHLGVSVEAFIAARRDAGDSYRRIALAIRDASNGEIDVTDVTVRAWHLHEDEGAPELRAATA